MAKAVGATASSSRGGLGRRLTRYQTRRHSHLADTTADEADVLAVRSPLL